MSRFHLASPADHLFQCAQGGIFQPWPPSFSVGLLAHPMDRLVHRSSNHRELSQVHSVQARLERTQRTDLGLVRSTDLRGHHPSTARPMRSQCRLLVECTSPHRSFTPTEVSLASTDQLLVDSQINLLIDYPSQMLYRSSQNLIVCPTTRDKLECAPPSEYAFTFQIDGARRAESSPLADQGFV